MNQWFSKVWIYRLAIIYGAIFFINAIAMAVIASLANVNWDELSETGKIVFWFTVTANCTGTMLAFISKTVASIESGNPPIPDVPAPPKP